MIKRKLATLVAASFAGLMLSSPSFATDAQKAQTTSGSTTSAQTTASASGAPESRSIERADEKAAESNASGNSGTSNQTESERAASTQKAEADYKAAVEKCNVLPTGQRDTCIQDAEAAQTLALEKSRDGTQASGAPESRSIERADDKAAESDASSNTAMKNQTDSNTPSQTGAPESRVPGQQSKK